MLEFEVVKSPDIDRMIRRLEDFDRLADRYYGRAMKRSVVPIEASARRNAPVGVSSALRGSIASEVKVRRNSIIGRVGSTMRNEVYPLVMERGRKPGSFPPPGALNRWVKIVLNVPAARVPSVAFLVGRKIARRGIVGHFFMRKAYFKHRRFVVDEFEEANKKIVEELAGGRS